jgi:hypothetical protein
MMDIEKKQAVLKAFGITASWELLEDNPRAYNELMLEGLKNLSSSTLADKLAALYSR